jgi:drug/metabolite transporter (DMT)-like permease
MVVPFPLIAFGEQRVASSIAAILVAALPLVLALLAPRFAGDDRVTGLRLAGLGVGLAGVVTLVGVEVSGSAAELLGAGAILLGLAGYAAGALIITRSLADVPPIGPVTGALAVATVLLAPPALLDPPAAVPSGDALVSIVLLGVLCTALAFVLMFALIGSIGPSRASVITYVNPVVAVALGVAFLGEPITGGAVAGLLLILAGSYLATGGGPPGALLGRASAWNARRTGPRPSTPSARPGSSRSATRAATRMPRRSPATPAT